MKIALVGLGYWGSKLLRNLVELAGTANIIAIDSHIERIATVCTQYPGVQVHTDLDTALQGSNIEAVVIATPIESHSALARAALVHGCHVFVEKPLTASVAEADALVKLADHNNRTLMVGHTLLFSHKVQWIANYINGGDVGDVRYLTSSRLNLGMHRTDANVLWDLAPHDFSVIFHLLNEYPVSVQTSARSVVCKGIPDVAFINLEFASGTTAAINVSWLAPKKVRNMVLVGDNTMVAYDDTVGDEPVKVYDKGVVRPGDKGFRSDKLIYRYGDTVAPHIPAGEPLRDELKHFLSAAAGDEDRVISDGHFGLEVVRALEAADRSWREGGVPVGVAPNYLAAR